MKKFEYFVSCAYDDNPIGYGNCSIITDHLITTMDSIKNTEKLLANQIQKEVIVLNFQLLREIEENDE